MDAVQLRRLSQPSQPECGQSLRLFTDEPDFDEDEEYEPGLKIYNFCIIFKSHLLEVQANQPRRLYF